MTLIPRSSSDASYSVVWRRAALGILLMSAWLTCSADATTTPAVRFSAENGVPDPYGTDAVSLANREVLRAFLEQHPDIAIDGFSIPRMENASSDSGTLMAIAAGTPPHAIYVNFRLSSTYLDQGFLEPMEHLLARVRSDDDRVRQVDEHGSWLADPTTQEIQDALDLLLRRMPRQAANAIYQEDPTGRHPGRHIWALPTRTLVMALLYRKDLFSEAGLDPQQPPRNWDELAAYARRLTIPEKRQHGLLIVGGQQALAWGMYTLFVANGARVVGRDAEGQWRAVYASREAAEAIEYLWRLAREPFENRGRIISTGAIDFAATDYKTLWQQGRIAMRFAYLDEQLLSEINPQLVGIAPAPMGAGGGQGSEINFEMLGVFSGSSPRQKLAVIRYIWFLTGDEAARIRTRVLVEHGYGSFVNPELLRRFGYEHELARVPPGWQKALETAVAHGVPEPYGRNTQNIYRYLSLPVQQAMDLNLHDIPREAAIARIEDLLKDSQAQVNQKLLGHTPAAKMRTMRITAGLAITMILAVFTLGGIALWRSFSRPGMASVESGRRSRRIWAWGLLTPAVLVTAAWMYVPLICGLVLAFTDYRLSINSRFVGVDNFALTLFDRDFWASSGRTMLYVAMVISLGFWPPILLAILLDEVPTRPLKYLFRTLFYLPAVVSGVTIMFLWKQLYDPSPQGVLNQLLLSLNTLGPVLATLVKWIVLGLWLSLILILFLLSVKMREIEPRARWLLGSAGTALLAVSVWAFVHGTIAPGDLVGRFTLSPLRYLQSMDTAMLCVVLPIVWAGAGPGCLLYLAALKTIPDDLYEAADIDGAGIGHKVCYIMLPRLKYLIGIQFIAAVVAAFKGGADFVLAMTGGGPLDATMVLALHIFIRTFMDLEFGLGAAMAWLLGALLLVFTACQLRLLSRAEFSTSSPARTGST